MLILKQILDFFNFLDNVSYFFKAQLLFSNPVNLYTINILLFLYRLLFWDICKMSEGGGGWWKYFFNH